MNRKVNLVVQNFLTDHDLLNNTQGELSSLLFVILLVVNSNITRRYNKVSKNISLANNFGLKMFLDKP